MHSHGADGGFDFAVPHRSHKRYPNGPMNKQSSSERRGAVVMSTVLFQTFRTTDPTNLMVVIRIGTCCATMNLLKVGTSKAGQRRGPGGGGGGAYLRWIG